MTNMSCWFKVFLFIMVLCFALGLYLLLSGSAMQPRLPAGSSWMIAHTAHG